MSKKTGPIKKTHLSRCCIIAEAGVNHNGNLRLAKKMVRVAALAGVDFIKFQTFIPSELATASAPMANYQKKATKNRNNQKNLLANLCLNPVQFISLKKECSKQGIGFLSTAFDEKSLKFVESLKPKIHKISSGDIENMPLLQQVAGYGREVILSTGMSTMVEIQKALKVLAEAGLPRSKLTVLQCHTEYPTRPAESNLRVMGTFRKRFGVRVGFSDHTPGIYVSLAAVALGASVIEKHFTLDRSMEGPDHRASLEPRELQELVRGIREVEVSLGDGVKKPSPREMIIRRQARKYLVATRAIREGERMTPANLGMKRSGGGIPASRWSQYLGKKATRAYRPDEVIHP